MLLENNQMLVHATSYHLMDHVSRPAHLLHVSFLASLLMWYCSSAVSVLNLEDFKYSLLQITRNRRNRKKHFVYVSFRKSAEQRTIASSAIPVNDTYLHGEGNQQQDCPECVQRAVAGGQHLHSHVC